MEKSINLGRETSIKTKILTPLVHLSKAQIVQKAFSLKVPLQYTWSCYEREDLACGVCDSCRLRLKGFKEADKKDLIKYAN